MLPDSRSSMEVRRTQPRKLCAISNRSHGKAEGLVLGNCTVLETLCMSFFNPVSQKENLRHQVIWVRSQLYYNLYLFYKKSVIKKIHNSSMSGLTS
jgi:hypothetical protein